MERKIILNGKEIPYYIRLSARAKRVSLTVGGDGKLVAVLPKRANEIIAKKFIKEKQAWVLKHVCERERLFQILLPDHTKKEYEILKQYAHRFVVERINKIKENYNFSFNSINIKNNKSQWGSCSKAGNLSFTYKIIFLPEKMAEYIIVHELCHLEEFNHSKRFWMLVGDISPNYEIYEQRLKKYFLV